MATLSFRYRAPAPPPEAAAHPIAARMAPAEPGDPDIDEGRRDRWWYESSYDLRAGLEVDDSIGHTLPGDVIDQLFKR